MKKKKAEGKKSPTFNKIMNKVCFFKIIRVRYDFHRPIIDNLIYLLICIKTVRHEKYFNLPYCYTNINEMKSNYLMKSKISANPAVRRRIFPFLSINIIVGVPATP